MRLDVDFRAIEAIAARFRSERKFEIKSDDEMPLERIDIELVKGIEIQLSDLESVDGLLAYKGRHVILYIRDHAGGFDDAIRDPENGKRFHVADCETLEYMRSQGRFERYVVTQSTTGDFEISGTSYATGRIASGVARLKVCKNCLRKLNYDSYALARSSERNKKRDAFDLLKFFETYSTRFRQLPRGLADRQEASGYSPSWPETSRRLREAASFTCEGCTVSLRDHPELLHVHHVNGIKNDDRRSNLRVLCKDCHRKEPMHGHIFISRKEMSIITRLRTEQGVRPRDWEEALRLADLAMRPTMEVARHQQWGVPEFDVEVPSTRGRSRLDVVWKEDRRAIVYEKPSEQIPGWRIDTAGALLDELSSSLRG